MERVLQSRYRVVRELGRGGLGAVYLCEDLRLPSKHWALKQMHSPEPEMASNFRETFEREAAILARLRHPNLPLIVDYFEEEEDAFLVMEYVEGENLNQHVRRVGPMREATAFRCGLMIVDLLVFLHAQKPPLIFRDLKPDNVMLTPDRTIKLIDFGLARRFTPGKRSDTLPSGSVGYAAPEQWEETEQTDERSDIYSWGATMVHLLSGKVPSPVFPLSALREVEPALSEPGRAILARCVKARPVERYESAEALSRDIRRHLDQLGPPTEVPAGQGRGREPGSSPARKEEPGSKIGPAHEPHFEAPGPGRNGEAARRSEMADGHPVSTDSGQRRRASDKTRTPSPPRPAPPSPRLAASSSPLPLILLIAATLAFATALGVALPRGGAPGSTPRSAAPALIGGAGVGPYQIRQVENRDKEAGRKLYEEGRYDAAIGELDRATTQVPEDAEAHILKNNAYARLSAGPVLRIPFIVSMTGVDGPDSYSQMHGIALAQFLANQKGGVDGRKIVVDVYDDHSSTSQCLEIAEKLVRDPEVEVVIGPYNSQRALAVAPIFNGAHVNLVAPVASARPVWQAGPYVFSASDSTDRRVKAMARYAVHAGYKRVAVVVDKNSRLSGEMLSSFGDEVKPHGVEVLTVPPYDPDSDDYRAQGEAIKSLSPDLIFFADYRARTTAKFVVQMRAMGIETRIMSQTVPFTRELVELGGEAVNGLLLAGYFHPDLGTAEARAFMVAFRRQFGDLTPTHLTVNTYDAFNAVLSGLASGKSVDREELNRFFHASGPEHPFSGVLGRFALGTRLDARPVWLIEVRNGRYRLLEEASD
jgi:serine/threonine protein kinase/ABC-type branched-subunit amino acid transport system substrate-binding protein